MFGMLGGREQHESEGGVNEHVNDDSCACHLTQKTNLVNVIYIG